MIYRESHTVDVLWAIDNDSVTVDDVDDDAGLTAVWTVSDEAEAACFNETFKHVSDEN
jgi:hypothetical protein